MVETGRVTAAEAVALRAATDPDEVEAAIRAIRLRHAMPKIAEALEDGSLNQEEAETLREQLANGEHARSLRARLRHRRRGHADG